MFGVSEMQSSSVVHVVCVSCVVCMCGMNDVCVSVCMLC